MVYKPKGEIRRGTYKGESSEQGDESLVGCRTGLFQLFWNCCLVLFKFLLQLRAAPSLHPALIKDEEEVGRSLGFGGATFHAKRAVVPRVPWKNPWAPARTEAPARSHRAVGPVGPLPSLLGEGSESRG